MATLRVSELEETLALIRELLKCGVKIFLQICEVFVKVILNSV
jgi:hypothetical protein